MTDNSGNDNLQFFQKLEGFPEEEETSSNTSGYFSSFIGQIFRSDGTPSTPTTQHPESVEPNNIPSSSAAPAEPKSQLERKESQESRGSDKQRSLAEKLSGLLKRGQPDLKNYNDSNFKQYWMPDSTGRECYQCEERFTTFRRRHHCRLCGQIFCSKCCNSHIDGASLGYMGELRLCDYCAKKVQRLAKEAEIDAQIRKDSHVPVSRKTSNEYFQKHKNSANENVRTISNGAIWSYCNPDATRKSVSPPTISRRESLIPTTTGVPTILSVADLCATTSTVFPTNGRNHTNSVVSEEEESGPDWFRSMNPGMDGIINNEASDSADVFAYANLAGGAIANEFETIMDARANDVTRKITFPVISPEESVDNSFEMDQRDNLDDLFKRNTDRMLEEVLKREGIKNEAWKEIILTKAKDIANRVIVNVPDGDSMNIADYVHVKRLEIDCEPSAEIIWGSVCSKSLLYNDSEPNGKPSAESIIIVGGSIEYERVANKLSSIEPIIVQEEKFLEKQIERISAKRASLVLVEGGVSRLAAQLLIQKNIKVAVNIKTNALQRIARTTNADILSNSDAQLVDQKLGFCPEFSLRTYELKNGTTKMLMCFSDCPKEFGCSVILKSNNDAELQSVKRVLMFLITVIYSNRLEQIYLNSFNTSVARRQSDCIVCETRRAIIYPIDENKTPFEKALDSAMLTSSPIIEFEPPFLETMIGRSCPLITYFKQPLYKIMTNEEIDQSNETLLEEEPEIRPAPVFEKHHAFGGVHKGSKLEILTRSFRAFSGISFRKRTRQSIEHKKQAPKPKQRFRPRDVLDPRVHQTLAVLFGSFSRKSPNAPYFCVRPWVVSMKYYNDHDMTLGEFLSKYCFNKTYECPSSNCEVSMLDHSRKLVYGRVCVEISTQVMNDVENSINNEQHKSIMAWRNCAKCNCSSQMIKFEHEMWHLSFAKFLDYLGNSCFTTDRSYPISSQNQCEHCFFHEKLYFFAFENLVTTFKVNAIKPYRVLFSPIICNLKVNKVSRKELGDDINRIANLALTICEETNTQLADLDEDTQVVPAVVNLLAAIRSTMALAGESRAFAKKILAGGEELIRSNDKLYRDVTDTFMRIREMTFSLIMLWNENCSLVKIQRRNPDDTQEVVMMQKLENPFPAYLHLAIKLQPRIGVVIRDIQDSRGNYKPDIGSIIAYALSAADYTKVNDDTISVDSTFKDTSQNDELTSTQHLEVEFEDESASYYVKLFYAEKFRKLRELLIAEGEETFIRSLSNSTFWTPQGGKSGSFFYRTQDDRFVVKQMSRFEIQSFVKFAPNYFDYLTTSATENKLTTLCKVYGVFRIGYKSKTTTLKVDILVMEYLFYNHNVSQVWDLKGSLRNRLASTGKSSADLVLLDENFVKDLWNQQLYVLPHSKAALNQAISNDSHFLSSQSIMDYSLLVGVDDDNGELILGIVDYMRTYTLDKKLESWVKIVAIPGAHLPTILSPEMYCARFSEAIDSYFPVVPDQWTGLGSISSC
ncbi:unnamed protein product [Caenorhabditis angaria]|uniref:1-phosphatidylinositol-3-phosphate 5-kinase n=1 Tax=Caenorhabditis angaria TaxID=860376 RepID=A0A9P1N935_9PELO|nr:unnamed protein product [Caenorhabditis angaria]